MQKGDVMKGFKDTTKTRWVKGYAQGGSVRGAAQVSQTMRDFKHGSKEEDGEQRGRRIDRETNTLKGNAGKVVSRMSPEDTAKVGGALGGVSGRETRVPNRPAAGALGQMSNREGALLKGVGKYGSFNRKPLIGG